MVTGRTKIFSCYRSYHGATLGASNASGDWRRYAAEIGGANGFVHFMNPQMYRDGYTKGVDDAEVTKNIWMRWICSSDMKAPEMWQRS